MALLTYSRFAITLVLAVMVYWSFVKLRARHLSSEGATSSLAPSSAPSSIGIVSSWCGTAQYPYARHRASRQCYARRHGYEYAEDAPCDVAVREGLEVYYTKVLALRQLLARFDALVWMDADVIVGKYAFPLERLLHLYPRASLIVPSYYPFFGWPYGNWFFLLRNTSWSHRFLERWLALGRTYRRCFWEQPTMLMLIIQMLTEHLEADPAARSIRLTHGNCTREADSDCSVHRGASLWWCFRTDLQTLGVDKMWAAMARGKQHDLPVAQLPYQLDRLSVTTGYLPPHSPSEMSTTFLAHIKSTGPYADAFFAQAEWPPPCNMSLTATAQPNRSTAQPPNRPTGHT